MRVGVTRIRVPSGAVILFLLVTLISSCDQAGEPAPLDHLAVVIPDSDPDMQNATEKARSSIDEFIELLRAPEARRTYAGLKVKMTAEQDVEYGWIRDVSYNGETFKGTN